ncbi:MAG: hypothetical protein AB1400_03705 [Pseudomonadota bacterium]
MRRALPIILLTLAGCAGSGTSGQPAAAEAEAAPRIGVVTDVTNQEVPRERGSSGAFVGGTVGNAGGILVGSGRGAATVSVIGGSIGMMMGDRAQNSKTVPGQELWIKLDNGRKLVVTQAIRNNVQFKPGDRVHVVRHRYGYDMVEPEASAKQP